MNRAAREILDAKLALEAELVRPLISVCARYIDALESTSGAVGAGERLGHLGALERVLIRHYARVAMVMTGRRPPKNPTLQQAALSLLHLESMSTRAKDQSVLILGMLDKEFKSAISGPAPAESDQGLENFAKEMGLSIETKDEQPKITAGFVGKIKAAAAFVMKKLKGKAPTIANVNTNGVAEEARAVSVVPDDEASGILFQEWRSLMDGRERLAHHNAHEQRRRISDPFDVGGEQLRFPGDTGLGASLGNVINCRCWLLTTFVSNDDGKETPVHTSPSAPARRFKKPTDELSPVLKPTSTVTLNGRTNARVVLGDRSIATMRQQSPTTIIVTQNRQTIARANIGTNGSVTVTVDPAFQDRGIEDLIRRSVRDSARMDRTPYHERQR